VAQVFSATILISGGGSNLQALIDARDSGRLDIQIDHVICNKPKARGVARAQQAGIPTSVLSSKEFDSRLNYDMALAELISTHQSDLVILAGFMRIIGNEVLQPFKHKMINLHPSLLPLFKGTDTYARAIDAGVTEHGASIHFVTADLDGGPVISQVHIPISTEDTPQDLANRLAPREHALMVATVDLFSRSSVKTDNGKISIDNKLQERPLKLMKEGHFEKQ
jgi:phosphoribosylglycinamide formyltransferase-1